MSRLVGKKSLQGYKRCNRRSQFSESINEYINIILYDHEYNFIISIFRTSATNLLFTLYGELIDLVVIYI